MGGDAAGVKSMRVFSIFGQRNGPLDHAPVGGSTGSLPGPGPPKAEVEGQLLAELDIRPFCLRIPRVTPQKAGSVVVLLTACAPSCSTIRRGGPDE